MFFEDLTPGSEILPIKHADIAGGITKRAIEQ
jgi:hypothetical protein